MSARKQTQGYDQEEERISEGVASLYIYTRSFFTIQGPETGVGYEKVRHPSIYPEITPVRS